MAHAIAPFGVVNTYATLEELKQRLAISSGTSTYDETLWKLLHLASRLVDRRCGRRFFVRSAMKRFDVMEVSGFQVTDLIEVAQMVEDTDGDGVYETVRKASTYALYPLEAEPESAHGMPYRRVHCTRDDATDGFTIGNSRIRVTGKWGYRAHWADSGSKVRASSPVSTSDKSIFVDADDNLAAGQTITINHEQMFVRQVAARTLGVERAQNGTRAATHAPNAPITVLIPPAEVQESVLITAVDRWLKRDGYAGGATNNGRPLNAARPEVKDLLQAYIRIGY